MLPHHGLIFLNEFDGDQTKIVDLSLFLCLWDSLIFKVSTKNQSMHEIEKKIMVSFPVEVHFKQKQYRLFDSLIDAIIYRLFMKKRIFNGHFVRALILQFMN